MTYVPMIDTETGELDQMLVSERAQLRAAREWGGVDFPPSYLRQARMWCLDRAYAERLQWRDARGLPREEEGVLTDISTWTDTFRRTAC